MTNETQISGLARWIENNPDHPQLRWAKHHLRYLRERERECDGSYTDPWESVEGVHGPVFGSNPDYSFAEHCDEMGLPSGERNAYLQRLEDRHSRAAEQC